MFYYTAIIPVIEGSYTVSIYEFPEIMTDANSLESAVLMAEEALTISLEEYTRERRKIPKPLSLEEVKMKVHKDIEDTKDCIDFTRDVFYQLIKAPNMDTKPVKITVSFPKNILEQIDKKADSLGLTRSKLLANGALAYEV